MNTILSPIVSTRTLPIFKMMKPVCIPHNNNSLSNLRNKLSKLMAINTNPKVLHDPDLTSCFRIQKPKRDR
ncbi:hypothetical protein HanRHA438_Chr03g0105001 [Helianthus annuus]|nr:hypothetical protein HanRHA438_Chr03g0105001 [Helianthus annuus]